MSQANPPPFIERDGTKMALVQTIVVQLDDMFETLCNQCNLKEETAGAILHRMVDDLVFGTSIQEYLQNVDDFNAGVGIWGSKEPLEEAQTAATAPTKVNGPARHEPIEIGDDEESDGETEVVQVTKKIKNTKTGDAAGKAREPNLETYMSGEEGMNIRPRGPSGESKPPGVAGRSKPKGKPAERKASDGGGQTGGKRVRYDGAAREMAEFVEAITPKAKHKKARGSGSA